MGLLDFFNTSTDEDLYGGLLSPQQRSGLAGRSLAAMAEKFGQLAMPQRAPIPLGAVLGQGFGAYGAGNDEAVKTLLEGLLRQQQVGDLKSKAKARDMLTQILAQAQPGGGGAPQGTASLPSIQGPLAAPAAGGAAAPAGGTVRGLPGLLLPEIKSADLGGDDSGTARFPDLGIDYPATDPSGLKAGGVLRRQAAATPSLSADLAPYQTGGLLAPQPADLPQLANYAVGNAVPGGASPITGVAPEMNNRLEAMLAGMPPDVLQKFNVLSGYRSPERQAVVNPGVTNSRHTAGTAVDTTTDPAVLDWIRQNGPQYGVGYTLAGMPGEANHLEMLGAGGGRAPIQTAGRDTVVPTGGGLPVQNAALTGSAREIADNNFGGMRRPGVIATPGQGGFQAFATPAEGLAAISRQLDRYASGATTGTPLTTIRQIVSTWAPPSENDTPTLIRRASQVVGVDPDTPIDVSNPAVKAKLIEATIRNEQGGKLPVPADLINQVASAPGAVTGGPDTVVATGDRPSLPVQRTQFSGQLQPPGAPGGPERLTPDGKIPGLNLTPAQAAQADALAELSGLGNPFKGLLETYYKSPGYLGQAAGATEAGRREVADPAEMRLKQYQSLLDLTRGWAEKGLRIGADGKTIEEVPGYRDTQTALTASEARAKEQARADAQKQLDDNQAMLTRETDRQRQNREAGFAQEKTTVVGPDGRNQETTMSRYDIALNQQRRAERIAKGDITPQPGDIAGTPVFNDFEKGIQAGGTKWFEAQRTAADAAAKNIQWNNESIKLLDNGIYSGWGSPVALQFARIFNIGGKDEQEKIRNTEKFLLDRGQQVAAQARLLPGPASDKDVAFLTSLALGNISLNEGTIRQMLELYNKYNRQTVDQYNDAAGRIRPDVIGGLPLKVPVDAPLKPLDPESRRNAEATIAKNPKAAGPIRNKIRAQGFDPEGL